jgi:hypothetical protein
MRPKNKLSNPKRGLIIDFVMVRIVSGIGFHGKYIEKSGKMQNRLRVDRCGNEFSPTPMNRKRLTGDGGEYSLGAVCRSCFYMLAPVFFISTIQNCLKL